VRTVLANGLVVDVVENHTVPLVAVRGLVMRGDRARGAAQPALPALTGR
jgi:predicted Zn-dependent peptidase